MNFYTDLQTIPSPERAFVKNYLTAELSKREEKYLWRKIFDHKWLLSERLKRDVGFRVAAVDYIENFYEPVFFGKAKTGLRHSLRQFFKNIARTEFLRPKSLS